MKNHNNEKLSSTRLLTTSTLEISCQSTRVFGTWLILKHWPNCPGHDLTNSGSMKWHHASMPTTIFLGIKRHAMGWIDTLSWCLKKCCLECGSSMTSHSWASQVKPWQALSLRVLWTAKATWCDWLSMTSCMFSCHLKKYRWFGPSVLHHMHGPNATQAIMSCSWSG